MKQIVTKFDEVLKTTSNIEEMKGKYLAKRLLRTWNEDFVDEDTSEVVSIERNELIMEKGELLDTNKLSIINFHLQSNDIKEVVVSDQVRQSKLVFGQSCVWIVSVELNSKNKTHLYLYANSIEMAIAISTDYLEQNYKGIFKFYNIKELDYFNLLSLDKEIINEELEYHFYKVEVEIEERIDDYKFKQKFLLKASDAEDAKENIVKFLTKEKLKENENPDFEVTIISAKTINCDNVIDVEFSKVYFEKFTNE